MNPAVAQLDRAFGFYPKCWGFDSLRPDQFLANLFTAASRYQNPYLQYLVCDLSMFADSCYPFILLKLLLDKTKYTFVGSPVRSQYCDALRASVK
jgi:hypothetical protein